MDYIKRPTAVPFSQDAMNDPYGTDAKALSAGRELDALVAEKVMGAQWVPLPPYTLGLYHTTIKPGYCFATREFTSSGGLRVEDACPHFSTDIAAAWLVMEKVREQGWRVVIEVNAHGDYEALMDSRRIFRTAKADSAPLAICRAALAATAP